MKPVANLKVKTFKGKVYSSDLLDLESRMNNFLNKENVVVHNIKHKDWTDEEVIFIYYTNNK